jgi:hypothetical protein
MSEKPEVFLFTVQIEAPSPRCPPGRKGEAGFTLVNDVVTVTDKNGKHLRDGSGKEYSFKLEPPTNTLADALIHARRLFKDFVKAMGGSTPRGFSSGRGWRTGKLNYRKGGIV